MSEERPEGGTRRSSASLRERAASAAGLLTGRRWLLGVLAGVVGLGVVLVLPAHLASRPSFLQRYAGLEAEYSSWARSTHAAIDCRSCHVPPSRMAGSGYRVRLLGEFYASVVAPYRQPDLFGTPTNEACELCHSDVRQTSPSGDLRIPHRAHVQVLGLTCVHCHSYVVHETNPEGTHAPRMVTCLGCHDGRQAKGECSACHQWKDAPAGHRTSTWLVQHADRRAEDDCESCHAWTPDWCRQCHSQRPASHAGRWRSNHRYAVERHRNCEACHRPDFCVRCHGEQPRLRLDEALDYVE